MRSHEQGLRSEAKRNFLDELQLLKAANLCFVTDLFAGLLGPMMLKLHAHQER